MVVGPDPTSATARYYYVYNAHGDVVNLVDASGNVVASYASDTWGALTSASERFGPGVTWSNSSRYDGRDGVRYDPSTGLSWMSVRAYDLTLGRGSAVPNMINSKSIVVSCGAYSTFL